MSGFRRRLLMQNALLSDVVIPKEYIEFVDTEVERICIENWSSDGIGLTIEDAENVTNLNNKFKGNENIQSFNELKYFKNLKTINSNDFNGCILLSEIDLSNIEYIYLGGFYNSGISGKLSIPKLKILTGGSFYNSKITDIKDLGSITSIQDQSSGLGGVFSNCSLLKNVTLPNTLKTIGWNAFYKCTSLKYVFLPESLLTINTFAFYGCTELSEISLPQSLSTIQNGAFYQTNISCDIDLPNLSTLSGGVFNGTKIKNIVNLGNIKTLAEPSNNTGGTFANCLELIKAILPSSLQTIGGGTFSGCTSLNKIILYASTPPVLKTNVFTNTSQDLSIYVPDESLETYKTTDGWINYADRIKPISEYVES